MKFFIDADGWNDAKNGCHGDQLRWWNNVCSVVVSDVVWVKMYAVGSTVMGGLKGCAGIV